MVGALPDLFSQYPYQPAPGKTGTSHDEADKVKPKAKAVRRMVYDLIKNHGPLNYKEVGALLLKRHISERTSQPRLTELKQQGFIKRTGQQRDGCDLYIAVEGKKYE